LGCASARDLQAFAERNSLPVATTFRRQALFDNEHPLYAGTAGIGIDPALAKRVREADVILAVGTRLDDVTTSAYTIIEAPRPHQRLIHVYRRGRTRTRVLPELAIEAGPNEFTAAVAGMNPVNARAWKAWAGDAHADYVKREAAAPSPGSSIWLP